MTLASFDDLRMNFLNDPGIGGTVSGGARVICRVWNSHCQLIYRIAHRFAEIL